MLDEEDGSLLHCMAWRLAVGTLHPSAVSIRVHSFEQRSNDSFKPSQCTVVYLVQASIWLRSTCLMPLSR